MQVLFIFILTSTLTWIYSVDCLVQTQKMSKVKLNLIAAAAENMGIGVNGTLPWRLKKEMAYFSSMTTKVSKAGKVNAVIMGRKTWDGIPLKYRPLAGRVNIVLTRDLNMAKENMPVGVIVVQSLDEAISYISGRADIESSWVIGGSLIYKLAMDHTNCYRIYLTEIQKSFECDTFFPSMDRNLYRSVEEEGVPRDLQVEGDVSYYFRIYEKL